MPKFKQPLSKDRNHIWGATIRGCADVDPNELADSFAKEVASRMQNEYGINVSANATDVVIGGLLNSKTYPGVDFKFEGHSDYGHFLVGFSKTAAMISIDVVGLGTVSSAMQRVNSANARDKSSAIGFSVIGALQRAVTDTNAVEEESMCYGALQDVIQEVVESYYE